MRHLKLLFSLKMMLTMLLLAGSQRGEPPKDGKFCTPRSGCMCIKQVEDLKFCNAKGERTAENMMCMKYCDMKQSHCCPVD